MKFIRTILGASFLFGAINAKRDVRGARKGKNDNDRELLYENLYKHTRRSSQSDDDDPVLYHKVLYGTQKDSLGLVVYNHAFTVYRGNRYGYSKTIF